MQAESLSYQAVQIPEAVGANWGVANTKSVASKVSQHCIYKVSSSYFENDIVEQEKNLHI